MYLQPLHRAVLRENAVYRQNKKGFDFAIKGDIWFWFWACVCLCCFFSQRLDIGVLLVCREVFALASTINTLFIIQAWWGKGTLISIRYSCAGLWAGEMEPNNKCEFGRLDYKDP